MYDNLDTDEIPVIKTWRKHSDHTQVKMTSEAKLPIVAETCFLCAMKKGGIPVCADLQGYQVQIS